MEICNESPGWIILAFGLTQYNFGAVVLTLKANAWLVGFDKVKYSVVCLVNEPKGLMG